MINETTRWAAEVGPERSRAYADRLREMAASGADITGEARLVDAIVAPRSRVLDAGCGSGRVGAELAARGHVVVGVDADPVLIAVAREDHPRTRWLVGDLTRFDLVAAGETEPFDAIVAAGNVFPFLAPGTERTVLIALAAMIRPDGPVIVGFATDRSYAIATFDADLAVAGFVVEQRFATWDLRPWMPGGAYAVSVLRTPGLPSGG